jgi:hypothetical protein
MRDYWKLAWHRFNIITGIISDTNARVVALIFYFTILVPFGLGSTLFSDPLRRKTTRDDSGQPQHAGLGWVERDPVPDDIDSARQQG